MGEPLDETQFVQSYFYPGGGSRSGPGLVIRGKHRVQLEAPADAAAMWRPLADRVYSAPLVAVAPGTPRILANASSALAAALPPNVQIVTLQAGPWRRLCFHISLS